LPAAAGIAAARHDIGERAVRILGIFLQIPQPIQPLLVGSEAAAVALSEALFELGFWVPAIRPPTVPVGTSRLRFTFSAAHTVEDVDRLLDALAMVRQRGSFPEPVAP
jgi:8-amino-7-oxononanoate synthase